jgi:hypothetical protein
MYEIDNEMVFLLGLSNLRSIRRDNDLLLLLLGFELRASGLLGILYHLSQSPSPKIITSILILFIRSFCSLSWEKLIRSIRYKKEPCEEKSAVNNEAFPFAFVFACFFPEKNPAC